MEGYLKVALDEMDGPFSLGILQRLYTIVRQNGQKLPIWGLKLHVPK